MFLEKQIHSLSLLFDDWPQRHVIVQTFSTEGNEINTQFNMI